MTKISLSTEVGSGGQSKPGTKQQKELRALILDMDGVIWREDTPIGDLPAIFHRIQGLGLQVMLATNNATRSIEMYVQRLAHFGVQVEPWQVINSAQATGQYLKERFPEGGNVFVVGEQGLLDELEAQGFYHGETQVLAVVVGMDRSITYDKLRSATLLIRNGAPFIATNGDRSFPTPQGLAPGAGAILAALEAASDEKPVVLGKPAPEMYRMALQRLQLEPVQALVVGDRLETDIAGGQTLGCRTALVLSGVSSEADAQAWQPNPDFIVKDLQTLLELL